MRLTLKQHLILSATGITIVVIAYNIWNVAKPLAVVLVVIAVILGLIQQSSKVSRKNKDKEMREQKRINREIDNLKFINERLGIKEDVD
ncbi:hypothetical protein ACFL20_10475 [Spirochaetota bacterium]